MHFGKSIDILISDVQNQCYEHENHKSLIHKKTKLIVFNT